MKRTTFRLSALTLTVATFLGACTLISEVDRSKIAVEENIPDGMGGDGAGGTPNNAGGDGGDGGADSD